MSFVVRLAFGADLASGGTRLAAQNAEPSYVEKAKPKKQHSSKDT
jgi:hypothetical protein